MAYLDTLLKRNEQLAAQQSAAGTLAPSLHAAMVNIKALVIGCADMASIFWAWSQAGRW